jgi:diguanylate cyclase (GGDEF)-like protein
MNLHILHLPRLIAERRSTAILGMIIIVMLWAGVILKYAEDVQRDRREAERTNSNFAMLFEENVLRSIGEIDKALLYLRRSIETRKEGTDVNTIVNTTDVLSEIIVQVGTIDAKGIMRASNAGPQPPSALDLSDREHYKVHVHGNEDQLFISKPVVGRASGRWSVQVSRRFSNSDGTFAGVVVASLDPEHFTKFYDKIDFGPSASITLIGSDGFVRSSGGKAGGFALGQDLNGTNLLAHMAAATNATFDDDNLVNGEARLTTLRKVRGNPLWVSVSTNKSEIYKNSWDTFKTNVMAGGLLTLLILAAMERILRTETKARREAEQHASEDPLTSLPNRRVFRSTLDQMSRRQLSASSEAQPPAEFAVLFLDLDRFKVVNDTLGHRVGDLLLQEVAKRLGKALQAADVLARLGGDEFAIVVRSFKSRAALEALADTLTEVIGHPYEIDGHRIRSSVSIGIAIGPPDGENADDLLMAADLALYAVKAGARGTHRFYERSMNEEINERRQIELDLREAIENGELELHYQPIIDLKRNAITGFEALARWRHPVKGMIPPAVFIPAAEDSGLILPLGAWALAEACRRAAQWPDHLKVAVNLSPVQISTSHLPEIVGSTLARAGLAPHRLELEITERIFMEDGEKTLSTLHRLKELGVRISMDDFGTGYSSLSYLRSFPYDKIKVDRTFVSRLDEGTEHVVIVQAVVNIARTLGMTTTAEGIETVDQQQFLAALGCDEAQGYLFSPPVPIGEVPKLIAEWTRRETLAA